VSYWLKMIGASDFKLEERPFDDWNRQELTTQVRFPRGKVPRDLTPGDELVYYAVGYQRIFAMARLTGDVVANVPHPHPEIRRRWPDAAPIELGPHLRDLANAPLLRDVVPALKEEIYQGVTIVPMGHQQFASAVAAIRRSQAAEELRERRLQRQQA
jgi:hypothetical protein